MTKGDDTSRSGQIATGEAMNNCGAKDRAPVRLTLTAKLERQLMADCCLSEGYSSKLLDSLAAP